MPSAETVFFALSGGILPALLWLWFWLKEDRLHPEPRGMIIKAFVWGMVAVPLVLPLEELAQDNFAGVLNGTFIVILLWSVIEELFKFGAAYFSALRTTEFDEPIDAVIYLVTAALGFAALENTLFLLSVIPKETLLSSIVTGNLRFVGATLLHVLASGTIGLTIGLSFYAKKARRELLAAVGVILAIVLHTVFNLSIMRSGGNNTFIVFSFVWVAIVLFLIGVEKVKRLNLKR